MRIVTRLLPLGKSRLAHSAYGLVWGGQLLHGHLPDYTAFGAPTPHPLLIAAGALGTLIGRSAAYPLFDWLGFLSGAVALIWHRLSSTRLPECQVACHVWQP